MHSAFIVPLCAAINRRATQVRPINRACKPRSQDVAHSSNIDVRANAQASSAQKREPLRRGRLKIPY